MVATRKRRYATDKVLIQVKVDADLAQRLDVVCAEKGLYRTDIIVALLEKFLKVQHREQ